MAKVTAPLFSFTASGKLANALVAFSWKGISVFRKYVIPANPKTAAQITQRGYMTAAVSAWKNYFLGSEGREAWNRLALYLPKPMSGFNAFVRNVVGMVTTDPNASFADTVTETANQMVTFGMENVDDGAAGNEAGNFDIWVGDTISGMVFNEAVAIAAGDVVGTVDLGDVDDVKYCKLRKDSFDRSGIFKITLIA